MEYIVSTEFRAIRNFQFTKNFITQEIRQKAGILRCERMETITHFTKKMMAQPSLYY